MSIYHGTKFGFVQSAVYDQMGVSLEGRLANASDINLVDAISVGETAGIPVGLGVTVSALSGVAKPGINDTKIMLPTSSAAATDFFGIVVRTETGHTDANGVSYMAHEEMASVLRATRVGGRIWVKAQAALTTGGNIYWIKSNTTSHGLTVGGFTGTAITSDTVQLTNVKVLTGASAGGLALIELLG